jgi:hypothetical protein
MRFVFTVYRWRKTAKFACKFHKTNEEVLNELNVSLILDKISNYKTEWIQHVNRMSRSTLPNLLKDMHKKT